MFDGAMRLLRLIAYAVLDVIFEVVFHALNGLIRLCDWVADVRLARSKRREG